MSDHQATLFDTLADRLRDEEAAVEASPDALESRDDRIGRAFAAFHREKPWVAERLVAMARRYQAANRQRGIGFFFELLRHERLMDSTDPQGFKLNNNFRSRYARLIERENPDLSGFFRKRRLVAR